MKVDKYIFCFPKANRWASAKIGVEPLTPSQLQVLYAVRRLGTATNATIITYLRKMQNKANENAISYALRDLSANGLLIKDKTYNVSPSGREWMALVRRYLVNVRL